MCDPDHDLYRAYGIGHWQFQQIMLSDPLREYLDDPVGWAAAIQQQRRESGRPLVDDPWRATAEFVIGTDGVIRFAHANVHCYDPPTPDARRPHRRRRLTRCPAWQSGCRLRAA